MSICKKCTKMVVMDSFSVSKCKHCGGQVVTAHMPAYEYCEKCSDTLKVCEQCGDELK